MTEKIHRIDPRDIKTLCGLGRDVRWLASLDPAHVTCRACQRVAERRARKAQRQRDGLPPAGDLGSTGGMPE